MRSPRPDLFTYLSSSCLFSFNAEARLVCHAEDRHEAAFLFRHSHSCRENVLAPIDAQCPLLCHEQTLCASYAIICLVFRFVRFIFLFSRALAVILVCFRRIKFVSVLWSRTDYSCRFRDVVPIDVTRCCCTSAFASPGVSQAPLGLISTRSFSNAIRLSLIKCEWCPACFQRELSIGMCQIKNLVRPQ
jgi:hypothetical protein